MPDKGVRGTQSMYVGVRPSRLARFHAINDRLRLFREYVGIFS